MSYEQILNLKIRKLKSYFPIGKRLVFDGKIEIIDGKGVSFCCFCQKKEQTVRFWREFKQKPPYNTSLIFKKCKAFYAR